MLHQQPAQPSNQPQRVEVLKVITYTLLVGSFPFAGRDGDTAMLQRISGGKCGDLGCRWFSGGCKGDLGTKDAPTTRMSQEFNLVNA